MLEMYEEGSPYEKMREHLVRVEFIAKQKRELSGKEVLNGRSERIGGGIAATIKCFNCHRIGHKSNNQKPYVPIAKVNNVRVEDEGALIRERREIIFARKIDPMKGMIGGIVTEAVLDTGAEVSLISMRRVGGMGVRWEECNNNGIRNASGDVFVIVGKCVMEVELPIGKKVDVGFFVSRDRLGEEDQVLLGNAALHAMGIDLVELPKEGGDECVVGSENKAIVGKSVIVGPGETGKIWLESGIEDGENGRRVRCLWSDRDEIVDGIVTVQKGIRQVSIPIVNMSNEDVKYEYERKEREEIDRKKQILDDWKREQELDDFARNMVERLRMGQRDEGEEYTIPFSNKKISISDCILMDGLLCIIDEDHRERLYVPEGMREKLVRDVHENPFEGHIGGKRLVEMMRREIYWGSMLKDVP
ncbi:hypothetical protein PENTCL1PPCAC_19211 [Pristionchus entomophagus]|uniref:RNA-directed DNA polymerase n=1 Tax=Pristionchus entomophagus TaxID=358040 RepID=A0AAV5TRN0_9BILA|nr:hypothetical protein PENTCL1PPCAC_19211 [Pristionchus entomophagus]